MGHPRWDLWPIVIDPHHAPDAEGAGPYLILFLACLPALDMTEPAVARRVLEAILETGASDADRRKLATIILKRASRAARQILEDMMSAVEWKDDWIESFVDQGRAEGRAEREIEDLVTGVLRLLSLRNLHPGKKQVDRVRDCTDRDTLRQWFDRAATAANAKEVFSD